MSIAMLSGGAARAAYYLDHDADCRPSRYYLEEAEPTGRWCGHGAAALGLDGEITDRQREAFAGLLNGRLPEGSQVALPVLRRDPANPDGPRIDIRRCGLDLVVSAPKSVSVLHALADPTTSAAVMAAHQAAVAEALGYLESSGRKATQRAAYVTRPAKSHTAQTSLRTSWAQRAEALGHSAPAVLADSIGRATTPQRPATASIAAELFGPDGLTKQATAFDRRDIIQALTDTLPADAHVTGQQLEATAAELLGLDDAIPLLAPTSDDGETAVVDT